ncbi:diguanylate cyclase [Marinobacterium sp. D7]|uniref:GGDEF domain-containing protein n=1 Tax=Marinobacterium ramblicola TaxID=2849041 RepID=UPI001C2CE624|nr:GGDEF domain-containing protein [Marinobacterium ramblicola]MBV1786620.1 diguanylate cyclase [Marinobacterium ramblicola]
MFDTPVASTALVAEADLGEREYPLLGARRVVVIAAEWSIKKTADWMAVGAFSCIADDEAERIASELLVLQSSVVADTTPQGDDILQAVIDAIPAPIFFKDDRHIYRGCNAAFSEFIGLPTDEVIGSSVYDVAPKELAERYYRADCELQERGGTQRYEAPVRYADGSHRDIEFYKAVFFRSDGRKGGQVGVMLDVTERNRLVRRLERSSRTDHLTGTGNRREFEAVAFRELRRHKRENRSLCLMCLDIDHFKQINDSYGHAVGDQALQFMVNCCRSQLREYDRLFRVGGEEFYILLPNTDVEDAYSAAQRLCDFLRGRSFVTHGAEIRMTVSIGVVALTGYATLDQALELADQALYRAKREGRNRVYLATETVEPVGTGGCSK